MRVDYADTWNSIKVPLNLNKEQMGFENEELHFKTKQSYRRDRNYWEPSMTVSGVLGAIDSDWRTRCITTKLSKAIYFVGPRFVLRKDFTVVFVKNGDVWYHNPTLVNRTEVLIKNKLGAIADENIATRFYNVPKIKKFSSLKERKNHLEEVISLYNNN